jgi:RHS repeat-associated protein
VRDHSRTVLSTYEFTPYGEVYAQSGAVMEYTFTGKPFDSQAGLYGFPYRYYSPEQARWMTRDPLGMVDGPNVYAGMVAFPVAGIWYTWKQVGRGEAICGNTRTECIWSRNRKAGSR